MSHTYKKNYLKQVIFRVDFESVDLGSFEEIKTLLAKDFDISKVLQGRSGNFEIKFDSNELINSTQVIDIWQFTNSETGNRFEIGPEHCLLEYFSYKNSDDMKDQIRRYCEEFLEKYEVKSMTRIGLRYINEIYVQPVKKITDWKAFISPDLITYSDFLKQNEKIATRMLNQVEMKTDDFNIIFKYGIWNDKYPSPITNSSFIVDIDGFTRLTVDFAKGELVNIATGLNNAIEDIFELSITDELRKEMDK
jgi:uncharacterized protein (TIGR04255 family)